MTEQLADEQTVAAPVTAQVAGRSVLLVPHRDNGMAETALPPEYQRILVFVRGAGRRWRPERSARHWARSAPVTSALPAAAASGYAERNYGASESR
ncbi:hypothetical protein [Streptomyces sp. NPDC001415]